MPFHVMFGGDPFKAQSRCRVNEIEHSSMKLYKSYVRLDVGVAYQRARGKLTEDATTSDALLVVLKEPYAHS